MHKLFISFIFVIMAAYSQVHSHNSTPMLWKITGSTLVKPSYIFATFHTKDPNVNKLPTIVFSTLSKSQRLYTEIKMSDKSTEEINTYCKLSSPVPLKKRLNSEVFEALQKYIKKERSTISIDLLDTFKIWAIALILTNEKEEVLYPNTLFMDERLIAYAKARDIKQVGLETPIEQLLYFDKLTVAEQEQLLYDTFEQTKYDSYNKALKEWYKKGSTDGFFLLQKIFTSKNANQQALDEKMMEGLLFERNIRFSRRIDILLQDNGTISYFFAIGAGHLAGNKGIIHRLQSLGYKLEKLF